MTTKQELISIAIFELLYSTKEDLCEYAFHSQVTILKKFTKIEILNRCVQRIFNINGINDDPAVLVDSMIKVKRLLVAALDEIIDNNRIPCGFKANKKEKIFAILLWQITGYMDNAKQQEAKKQTDNRKAKTDNEQAKKEAEQAANEAEQADLDEADAFIEMMAAKAAYEKAQRIHEEAVRKQREAQKKADEAETKYRQRQQKQQKKQSYQRNAQNSYKAPSTPKPEQPKSKYSHINFLALFSAIKTDLKKIKTLYREWVLKTHPDQGGEAADFIRLQKAYEWAKGYHKHG